MIRSARTLDPRWGSIVAAIEDRASDYVKVSRLESARVINDMLDLISLVRQLERTPIEPAEQHRSAGLLKED